MESGITQQMSPSDPVGITTTAAYEFTKSFVQAATNQLKELDRKESKYKTFISNLVGGLAGGVVIAGGFFLFGPAGSVAVTPVAKLAEKGAVDVVADQFKESDKQNQKQRKKAVTTTIDAASSKSFKDTFNSFFMELGFQIYNHYKHSFEYISTKTESKIITLSNKRQVIQELGEYVGSACFKVMRKSGKLGNLEQCLTEEHLKKDSPFTIYFWVKKNGKEDKRMKTTPYYFFIQKPFESENFLQNNSSKNDKLVLLKTEFNEPSSFLSFEYKDEESFLEMKTQLELDRSLDSDDAFWYKLQSMAHDLCTLKEGQGELLAGQKELQACQEKILASFLEKLNATKQQSEPIWFQVHPLSFIVYGRSTFMIDLHKTITEDTRNKTGFVISGIGGLGKTTVVREYIKLYLEKYHHVIWIDAEDCAAAQKQFRDLAKELDIQLDSENNPADFLKLHVAIFKKLCYRESRVLLVLDNAEAIDTDNTLKNESLLPQSLPEFINLRVLITSRQGDWDTNRFHKIYLDLWTEEECIKFVLEKLNLPDTNENNPIARDVSTCFGRLPIAMQSAVSIIKKQFKRKQHDGTAASYGIKKLIDDCKSRAKGDSQLMSLWNVSFQKIFEYPHGKLAIRIICFMAYLSPNAIATDFLRALFLGADSNESERDDLTEAFMLLTDYSLITVFDTHYTIHRMIQEAVIQNLKPTAGTKSHSDKPLIFGNEIDILQKLSKQLHEYLSKLSELEMMFQRNASAIANSLYVTSHLLNNLSIPEFSDLTESVANAMKASWHYENALELYEKLLNAIDPSTDEEQRKSLRVKESIVRLQEEHSKYPEALKLRLDILQVKMNVFGPNHLCTLKTQCDVIRLLQKLNHEDEVLIKVHQVKEAFNEITQLEDQAVVVAKYDFALLILQSNLREYDYALSLFEEVLKEYEKPPQLNQALILRTKHCIANTLSKLYRNEEALERYYEIQNSAKEILGLTNQETINYRNDYAQALRLKGNLVESLKVLEEILKDGKTLLESEYTIPSILVTKSYIKDVLTDMKEQDKAVKFLRKFLSWNLSKYGSDNELTLTLMHNLGRLLWRQKNYKDSIQIHHQRLKIHTQKVGPLHSDTLQAKLDIGWVYLSKEEYEHAEIIAKDVLSTKSSHADVLPEFDYSKADKLLTASLKNYPTRGPDLSAADVYCKESMAKLEELYGIGTTVETCSIADSNLVESEDDSDF